MSIQTKNNKNQISIICGEIATNFLNCEKDFKNHPVILLDTKKVKMPQRLPDNFKFHMLGMTGTGANPEKGREIAKKNQAILDIIIKSVSTYSIIHIYIGTGGGTQGVGLQLADQLKELKYFVIVHPIGLLSMDADHGNRADNVNYAKAALINHCHFWINPTRQEECLKDYSKLIIDRVNLMNEVTNIESFDNLDYFNLFTKSKEFIIYKSNQLLDTQNTLNKFLSSSVSGFFIRESNKVGSSKNSILLAMQLKAKLIDNGVSKVSPSLADKDELLVIACK